MTDKPALLELAEKVAQSPQRGSRKLDRAITTTVLGGHCWLESRLGLNGRTPGRLIWTKPNGKKAPVPRFTASLDAAMQLVPEGATWSAGNGLFPDKASARVLPDFRSHPTPAEVLQANPAILAATPALALTSAALRALAEQGGEDG